MKIKVDDDTARRLRNAKVGLSRLRCWLDGFRDGRQTPGQPRQIIIGYEALIDAQLAIDHIVSSLGEAK